jgi:hypothetical protein
MSVPSPQPKTLILKNLEPTIRVGKRTMIFTPRDVPQGIGGEEDHHLCRRGLSLELVSEKENGKGEDM